MAIAVLGALFLILVGIGTVWNWMTASNDVRPGLPVEYCRNCGRRRTRLTSVCPRCRLNEADADDTADLRITTRNLRAFHREGAIDADTFERLRLHIVRLRTRIARQDETLDGPNLFDLPSEAPEAILNLPHLEMPSPLAPAPEPASVDVPNPSPALPVNESLEAAPTSDPPRRGWLASFMEDRNILWGELVGGLLMVGCSVALVLSLWQTLEQIPLFPFIVLATITVMLFGAGHYTLHHWKLESTSRGLLVIGLLLVPLTFLVLAGLSPRSTGNLVEIGIKALGVGLFVFLVPRAARVLYPADDRPGAITSGRLFSFALLGVAITPLLSARVLALDAGSLVPLLLLSVWPVFCHGAAIVFALVRQWNVDTTRSAALRLLGFVALTTFPLVLVCGFTAITHQSRFGDLARLLEVLAPYAAAAMAPIIAVGLFIGRRTARTESTLPALFGTGVAIFGAIVQIAALVTAWPNPVAVLAVTLICAVAWSIGARVFRTPWAHAVALPYLVVGYLIAFQMVWVNGAISPLHWRPFVSSECGVFLTIVALALAAEAERLRSLQRWDHGIFHAGAAGIVALISIGVASATAIEFPLRAASVGLVFIGAGMALGWRWRMPSLSRAAACLIPFTTLALLHGVLPGERNAWAVVLAAEALALSIVPRMWGWAVALNAVLAAAFASFGWAPISFAGHAITLTLLAATAVTQAIRRRSPFLAWGGSFLLLAACAQAIITRVEQLNWPIAALVFVTHAALLIPFLFARSREWLKLAASALSQSAKWTSVAAGVCVAASAFATEWRLQTLAATALAALWLIYLLRERHPAWFSAFQAASTLTILYGVAAWQQTPALIPDGFIQHFDAFGLALIATCIGWTLLRLYRPQADWLNAQWPAFDRIVLTGVLGGVVLMVVGAALPGVLIETLPLQHGFVLGNPRQSGGYMNHLLVALVFVLFLGLREAQSAGRQTAVLVGLTILGVIIPFVAAGNWSDQRATASALRWGLGLAFVMGTLLLLCRDAIVRFAHRCGVHDIEQGTIPANLPTQLTRGVLLLAAGGIPLILTLTTLGQLIAGQKPGGPGDGSFFRHIGFTMSHGIPLALIAAGLVGHALREREPGYAFSAGLIAKLLVAGGFAVGVALAGRAFDGLVWVELSQRVMLTAGLWALAWLLVAKRIGRFRSDSPNGAIPTQSVGTLWNVQLALAIVGNVMVLAVAVLGIAMSASYFSRSASWVEFVGGPLGWLALAAAALAGGLREWFARSRRWSHFVGGLSLCAVVLIACLLSAHGGGWGYRTLMFGWGGCALALASAAGRHRRLQAWVGLAAVLVAPLALKAALGHGDLWAAALALALVGLAALRMAQLQRSDATALAGTSALHLAVTLAVWHFFVGLPIGQWAAYLLQANALMGALVAAYWLRLRVRWLDARWDTIAIVQLTVPVMFLLALALPVLPQLLSPDDPAHAWLRQLGAWSGWLALLATAGAWLIHDRNENTRRHVLGTLGLFAGVWAAAISAHFDFGSFASYHTLTAVWAIASLSMLALDRERRSIWSAVFSALFVLLALRGAFHWSELRRGETVALAVFFLLSQLVASRFRRTDIEDAGAVELFVASQAWIGLTAIILSLIVSVSSDGIIARLTGPLAIALLLSGAVLLTNASNAVWKRQLSYATLSLGVILIAETGWAIVDSGLRGEWLHRSVVLLVALTVATIGYSFGLARVLHRDQRWAITARQIGPVLGLIAAGLIILIIGQEGLLFDKVTKHTPLIVSETIVVVAAIVALMVAAVAFAVKPWIDPFGLPERWRSAYVYGAEILLVLLFLHVRFNVPGLFPKVEAQMWAFIIMAIAFIGVGLAELFKRLRLDVLARPLQRTGVFLPVLPLLMFWLKPPPAVRAWLGDLAPGTLPLMSFFDQIPTDFASYSILWFLFGLLYAWVAVSRQSFRYALLASLAANVGLWALLYDHQITFLLHPQLWLVPLALIVLVSEHIHHDRLKAELSIGLRYLGLGMLYLSSTADLFITGLGNSTLLPLALALLSIIGVMAGILLRIKAYLFLGTGFLVLVVFSMIWHAAVDRQQTWVWWVCGIALGAAILAMFALFEKRRQQVLEVVDEIRRWR